MDFKKTFERYKEYKAQQYCYESEESAIKTDEEIIEDQYLLSNFSFLEWVDDPFNLGDVKGLNFSHDESIDLTRLNWLKKIQEIFEVEYKQYLDDEVYFYGCSFKVYERTYPTRLKEFQGKYIDASEIDFIKEEYVNTKIDDINRKDSYKELPVILSFELYTNKKYSLKKQEEFLKSKMIELGYEVNYYDEDIYSYVDDFTTKEEKYSIIRKENTNQIKNINSVNWTGTQTELIELVKALIENGSVKGKQKDIIKEFSCFFNIEINNPDKLIQDIKNRNNGSETLFIDSLKDSLLNLIKK